MDIENAFNLGLWRGAHRCKAGTLRCVRDVPLAAGIDRSAYLAGFDYARERAKAYDAEHRSAGRVSPRPNAHRPEQRRPDRRQNWTPGRGSLAA